MKLISIKLRNFLGRFLNFRSFQFVTIRYVMAQINFIIILVTKNKEILTESNFVIVPQHYVVRSKVSVYNALVTM